MLVIRPVVPGCARCAMAQPDFGRSVNPISTRGTDFAHLITTGTPGFSDLPTALHDTCWAFNYQGISPQFLQPFSIDSAGFSRNFQSP